MHHAGYTVFEQSIFLVGDRFVCWLYVGVTEEAKLLTIIIPVFGVAHPCAPRVTSSDYISTSQLTALNNTLTLSSANEISHHIIM